MNICGNSPKYDLSKSLLHLISDESRWRIKVLSVKAASDTNNQRDILSLDFEVLGLCQYPDYDIKQHEIIDIAISYDSMPLVYLRSDFPSVPHLNIHSDATIKSMCYSELPYPELRHKMNARFLLECINNWFVNTGTNKLHRPDQPLEPFFPYVRNVIILKPSKLNQVFYRFQKRTNSRGTVLIENDNEASGENLAVFILPFESEGNNIIQRMPKTLKNLLDLFPTETGYKRFAEFLQQLFLIKTNPNEYKSRFQQSDGMLQNCRCLIVPIIRQSDKSKECYDAHAFITICKVSAIVKDFGFKANKSKLEKGTHKGTSGENIMIEPYNVQFDITSLGARIFTGENNDKPPAKITIIGAGALGSHIINNCVHSGFGEWLIIDNDILWPHNIARHILTREYIGRSKADAIVEAMRKVMIDVKVDSINKDVFEKGETIDSALKASDLIIDASASPAVERHLAIEKQSTGRKVSFFLNPQGDATVMLFEDTKCSIRLDLLEMQYYATLLSNEKYAKHLATSDAISYAGTCRSISSKISQDDIALSAAQCCKALKKHIAKTEAAICIWTQTDNNLDCDELSVERWVEQEVNGWKTYIFVPLVKAIRSARQSKVPNETGGVLIGAFDNTRKILYIVEQIDSPDDSISSPISYVRGCHGLEQRLTEIAKVAKDNLYYIGEWHSHISSNTQMSRNDTVLLSAIVEYNREHCKPSCMLILGCSGYSIYVDE